MSNVTIGDLTAASSLDGTEKVEIEKTITGLPHSRSTTITDILALVIGSPLTTKGDVYTFSSANARLGVGSDGQVLTADSLAGTGLSWQTVAGTGTVTSVGSGNGLTGGPITGTGTLSVAVQMSVGVDGSGVKLLNDTATPGTGKLYGTDGTGTRGWQSIPPTVAVGNPMTGGAITNSCVLYIDGAGNLAEGSGFQHNGFVTTLTNGSYQFIFGNSYCAHFTDGTRTVRICDGTNSVLYTAATPGNWAGGSPPTDVWIALDRIAAALTGLLASP